ncbi:MAG: nucleoside recognition domain-containing protein [Bacteroidia bacterium]
MALNYIWIAFFIVAFVVASVKLILLGDMNVFPELLKTTFETSKTAFEISLGLTGVLTLWMGIMKIGENAGMINFLAKITNPFLSKLFPSIPKGHPVMGQMMMNFSANMLGLDNAATPMGLKAMNTLQELNPEKEKASDAQIMFLVLNTSGLTIIPVSVMVYRAQLGAANPADVFLPILLATFFSTLAGIITVSIFQKINLLNKWLIGGIAGTSALIALFMYWLNTLSQDQINTVSSVSSSFILMAIIVSFVSLAFYKKANVYDSFIEGAKDGFDVAIKIIPYLVAFLVAISVFRTSGALTYIIDVVAAIFRWLNINTDFIAALPTAIMKPLSGSGARGMMIDTMKVYGADSFAGRLSSIMQGATDTTFYILAVYFGSVNIRNTRYAAGAGLIADAAGIIAAIFIAYIFF